jgi:hypothetical protein
MARHKQAGPLSNSAAQGRAREVRELLRTYVNLHYSYVQAGVPDWRGRSRRVLERAAEVLAGLRADDARTGLLGDGLAGTAFERARCLENEGETIIEARHRGSAAEAAADLAEALRRGEPGHQVRSLFRELANDMLRLS